MFVHDFAETTLDISALCFELAMGSLCIRGKQKGRGIWCPVDCDFCATFEILISCLSTTGDDGAWHHGYLTSQRQYF